jgi:glycosyltransferase involved in cell wall biosynthesis
MTAHPIVSAILVSRRPTFLAGAVAMMRAQTYPGVELVVVLHGLDRAELPDPASEALALADRVLEVPGSVPFGTCLNRGIAASRGEMLAKIDDDDLYGPCYLAEAAAALAAGEGDVVGKMEAYVFLSDERQLLLWRAGASLQRQSGLAGPTLFFPRRLGEAPGFRPLPSVDSGTKRNGLSEADLDVFAKLPEQCLERGEEAEAFPRRQIVGEDDLLQLGVAQRVEVEVARQVAP